MSRLDWRPVTQIWLEPLDDLVSLQAGHEDVEYPQSNKEDDGGGFVFHGSSQFSSNQGTPPEHEHKAAYEGATTE